MNQAKEDWQVNIQGQIIEASLTEVVQKIRKGEVNPQDKVKKGNLRWTEASKVPLFIRHFNARTRPENHPVVQTIQPAVQALRVPVRRSSPAIVHPSMT